MIALHEMITVPTLTSRVSAKFKGEARLSESDRDTENDLSEPEIDIHLLKTDRKSVV